MTKEADYGGWRVDCRCAQNSLSDGRERQNNRIGTRTPRTTSICFKKSSGVFLFPVLQRSRPRDFWTVSQETGADFVMGPGLLCGFLRQLFAVGSADLGKRRRWVAFRADSAYETAQKFANRVRVRRKLRILIRALIRSVLVGARAWAGA